MAASGQAHLPAFLAGPLPRRFVSLTAVAVVAVLPLCGCVASAGAAPLGAGQAGPANGHTAGLYVLTADSTGGNYGRQPQPDRRLRKQGVQRMAEPYPVQGVTAASRP